MCVINYEECEWWEENFFHADFYNMSPCGFCYLSGIGSSVLCSPISGSLGQISFMSVVFYFLSVNFTCRSLVRPLILFLITSLELCKYVNNKSGPRGMWHVETSRYYLLNKHIIY